MFCNLFYITYAIKYVFRSYLFFFSFMICIMNGIFTSDFLLFLYNKIWPIIIYLH